MTVEREFRYKPETFWPGTWLSSEEMAGERWGETVDRRIILPSAKSLTTSAPP